MTYHGVPKPGWRGFQLMHGAGDHRVPAALGSDSDSDDSSSRAATQTGAIHEASLVRPSRVLNPSSPIVSNIFWWHHGVIVTLACCEFTATQ